jgi:hypothetical protein
VDDTLTWALISIGAVVVVRALAEWLSCDAL